MIVESQCNWSFINIHIPLEVGWIYITRLDIYIYDYMCKNQFKDCATLFNNRTRVTQEIIDIDTPEGFLKEWWSKFWNLYEMSGTPRPPEEYIDAEKMLHAYLFDYLKKRGYGIVADRLDRHTNCRQQKIEVNTVNGFLKDWWSTFWEEYSARGQRNHKRSWIGDELEKFYSPEKKYHRFRQPLYAIDIAMAPGQPRTAISQQLMQEEIFEIMPMPMPLDGVYSGPASPVMEAQVQSSVNFHNHQQQQVDPFKSYSQIQYSNPIINLDDVQMMNNVQMTRMEQEKLRQIQDFELRKLHAGVYSGPALSVMEARVQNDMNFHSQQHQQIELLPFAPYSQIQVENPDNYISYNDPSNNIDDVQMMNVVQMAQTAEEEARQKKDDERHKLYADIKNLVSTAKGSYFQDNQMMNPKTQTIGKQTEVHVRRLSKQNQEQNNQKSQIHKKTAKAEVLEETVELNPSHNDENKDISDNTLGALQPNSLTSEKSESKGFSLKQIGCTNMAKKVVCCHFSSDGKYFACGGQEKQVLLWGTESRQPTKMDEVHSDVITDIRFRPNSTIFATSSFDKTIHIWEANKTRKSLLKLEGHTEKVMSLDFHPKKTDILCSCDSNNEIRIWNVNKPLSIVRSFKGGNRQIRFPPQTGTFFAAASGNIVNVIDIETSRILIKFEGHKKDIRSLCWDIGGNRILSVSEDSAMVWNVNSKKCEQQLSLNGNKFESCSFHPNDSQLMLIGSYQFLIKWSHKEDNKTEAFLAHGGLISCVAVSPRTGMIASTSHDKSVKLWR